MSPSVSLRPSRRELPLTDRLAALREAVEIAEDRLEVAEVGRARALLAKAGAREALGDATVVALAGATVSLNATFTWRESSGTARSRSGAVASVTAKSSK